MSDEVTQAAWESIAALGGICFWEDGFCLASYHDTDLIDSDLVVFRSFNYIEEINLVGNRRLTDECLDHLENLPRLKRLSLYRTSITEQAAESFRQKNPSVEVISKPSTGTFRDPFSGEIIVIDESDVDRDKCQ
jgi:hypothetical protein